MLTTEWTLLLCTQGSDWREADKFDKLRLAYSFLLAEFGSSPSQADSSSLPSLHPQFFLINLSAELTPITMHLFMYLFDLYVWILFLFGMVEGYFRFLQFFFLSLLNNSFVFYLKVSNWAVYSFDGCCYSCCYFPPASSCFPTPPTTTLVLFYVYFSIFIFFNYHFSGSTNSHPYSIRRSLPGCSLNKK